MEDLKTIKLDENENFNVIKLNENKSIKNISLKTLLKGEQGDPASNYSVDIDLSTDMTNPTELMDYMDKSGIYVAKNTGVLGFNGEPFTILAKGQFFKVTNLKDYGEILGEEISDEDNQIQIMIQTLEGSDYTFTKYGDGDWESAIDINSANINEYVDIDTSNLITRNMINSAYGIQVINSQLGITPATQKEIDTGLATYKSITPQRIDYAVRTKGEKYFTTKDELKTLKEENDKLLSEIESVLDTVVTV